MGNAKNLRAIGDRIETLVSELDSSGDPAVREKAEELVRLLMEFYGGGLAAIVAMVRESGAEALLERFGENELVASLLVLHDLHPLAVEARVARALDRVRPYLGSHGGDVKLLGIEEGVVRLRLEGSCHSCPSSTVTMKLAVERAIEEAAPEVTRIELEGSSPPATAAPDAGAHEENGRRPPGEWIAVSSLPHVAPGRIAGIAVNGEKIILCRVGETLYSYRNPCPSCAAGLEDGGLQDEILTCRSCGRGYNVRLAGQAEDAGEFHLEPLPLLLENGTVKIAVPAAHN